MSAPPSGTPVTAAEYLDPDVPGELPWREVPLVPATSRALRGLGALVDDPDGFPVEVVPWPLEGWRTLDPGTGVEAGTTTGTFEVWWEGDVLFGRNDAVGGHYVLGWSMNPALARRGSSPVHSPARVLLWHANYHPDGGQLFFPLDDAPFVVPLAPPGDDVTPDDFVAFYVDGGRGLYIEPGVWHDAAFPLASRARFHDEQGRVHARVSSSIAHEFGVFLAVPLTPP
ncbi:MAG: ureidoglycolate lyase [Acidimicrobiales bacterium]